MLLFVCLYIQIHIFGFRDSISSNQVPDGKHYNCCWKLYLKINDFGPCIRIGIPKLPKSAISFHSSRSSNSYSCGTTGFVSCNKVLIQHITFLKDDSIDKVLILNGASKSRNSEKLKKCE